MKARKPGTDQDAEVHVLVNGKPAPEFDLPDQHGATARDDTVECFIPVNQGDCITVRGRISGSILSGSIDLVVDGSFLADSRIEGREIKHLENRKIEFKKALSCPIPRDWTSIKTPKDMVQGILHADKIDEETLKDVTPFELASPEALVPGLGSLQVVISLCQEPYHERYKNEYADITNGHWRTRNTGTLVRKSGIHPDYELKLQEDEDGEISRARSGKHRRHWDEVRAGHKPWAKFVFYYRSPGAIEEAGCIPRSDRTQELEPGDSTTFIRAEPKSGKKQQSRSKIDDGLFIPAISSTTRMSSDLSPKPTDPNKKLGGTLILTPDVVRRSSIVEDVGIDRSSPGLTATIAAPQEAKHTHVPAEIGRGDTGNETLAQDLNDAASSTSAAVNEASGEYSRATKDARDGSPSLASPVAQLAPKALHEDNFHRTTAPPQIAAQVNKMSGAMADLRKLPTKEDILMAIPEDGLDNFAMTLLYVNTGPFLNEDGATKEFERRRGLVAVQDPDDDYWYTTDAFAAKQAGRTRNDFGLDENQAGREEFFQDPDELLVENANPTPMSQSTPELIAIKQEEIQIDVPAPAPAPALVPTPTPALPYTPLQKTNGGGKRSTDSRPDSSTRETQSPAAKRAKTKSGPKAKRLLQEELVAKRARREEAEKQLKQKEEIKQAKQEAKKRRDQEEVAELQRQHAEEDARLAAVEQKLREASEDEAEEDDEDEEDEEEEVDEEHE